MIRPEIWLGDLLRVFTELDPTGPAAEAVERMLGLRTVHASLPTRTPGAWDPTASRDRPSDAPRVDLPPRAPAGAGPGGGAGASPLPSGARTRLVGARTASGPVPPPPWEAATDPMPAPDLSDSPAPDPILPPLTRRGILAAALATRTPDGPPDLERILEVVARGAPLREVPRVPVATLRRGVQVLADTWAGMAPFAADRDDLLAGLGRLFGPERMQLLWFAGDPGGKMGPGPRDEWAEWLPPPRGTPVLVVSDLGIGGPPLDEERASPTAWVRFAQRAREAGSPVVALVPFGPARWPRALAEAMLLVHWTERLTAGSVRHAVGRGHPVPA